MQEAGLAKDEVLAEKISYLKWHLGNEVGKRWWQQYKATETNDQIIQMIDKELAVNDYNQNREYMDALIPLSSSK